MKKFVIIKQKHNRGSDEMYCDFFICPNCNDQYIVEGSNYCSNLRWSKKIKRSF